MEETIIFGRKPILDALQSDKRFDKIMVLKSSQSPELEEISKLARQKKVVLQAVPKEKIEDVLYKNRIREANHQGIIGFMPLIDYCTIDDIIQYAHDRKEDPLIIILDGITDVHNLGAIARSAESMGAHGIVMQQTGSAQINAVALKVSAGALMNIPVCREQSILTVIKYIKANGIRVVGADLTNAVPVSQEDLNQPIAIVMGAEGEGIAPQIKKYLDGFVAIPMKGKTESLNVSVSAGIILYEAAKQRGIGK
jgi:23S rRNA (guanosine2251-2'-O)-methyltransferase